MKPRLQPLTFCALFARRASSDTKAGINALLPLLGLLVSGLPTALGQSNPPPSFTSIQISNNQITAVLAVPDWVNQITLESRTNAAAGRWEILAWQPMSGAGSVTYQLSNSQPINLLRARADAAPSFLERVRTGFGIISNSYPDAVLFAVDTGHSAATTNPNDISHLFIACRVNGATNTATITSTNALAFDPVQFVGHPMMGTCDLPWPITMDVMQAAILLEQAGYTGTFTSFAYRWPLYPGLNEPYYIFTMSTGPSILVGITSHDVFP
jgi:hypothetical protein